MDFYQTQKIFNNTTSREAHHASHVSLMGWRPARPLLATSRRAHHASHVSLMGWRPIARQKEAPSCEQAPIGYFILSLGSACSYQKFHNPYNGIFNTPFVKLKPSNDIRIAI